MIARLVAGGTTVVCGGGGGVPVVDDDGRLRGVDGVVDKDLTAAVLAEHLGADLFVVLTDVPGVMQDFGSPRQRLVKEIDASTVRPGDYPAGSMGPKVAACAEFVRNTGKVAIIGSLDDAAALLDGTAGTRIFAAQSGSAPLRTSDHASRPPATSSAAHSSAHVR